MRSLPHNNCTFRFCDFESARRKFLELAKLPRFVAEEVKRQKSLELSAERLKRVSGIRAGIASERLSGEFWAGSVQRELQDFRSRHNQRRPLDSLLKGGFFLGISREIPAMCLESILTAFVSLFANYHCRPSQTACSGLLGGNPYSNAKCADPIRRDRRGDTKLINSRGRSFSHNVQLPASVPNSFLASRTEYSIAPVFPVLFCFPSQRLSLHRPVLPQNGQIDCDYACNRTDHDPVPIYSLWVSELPNLVLAQKASFSGCYGS
jgi:hypothetical protein